MPSRSIFARKLNWIIDIVQGKQWKVCTVTRVLNPDHAGLEPTNIPTSFFTGMNEIDKFGGKFKSLGSRMSILLNQVSLWLPLMKTYHCKKIQVKLSLLIREEKWNINTCKTTIVKFHTIEDFFYLCFKITAHFIYFWRFFKLFLCIFFKIIVNFQLYYFI